MGGEQKSQSDEAGLSTLADVIPQIVWEAQPDGHYTYFSRRWYEYTGLTRESSLGTGWNLVIHPEDRTPCIQRWQRTTQTGQPFEVEYRLRGALGQYRWFLSRAVPRLNHEGVIVSWVGTSTDIDDQRRTQEEFRRGEAKFRLLAGAIPQVVWMADSRGWVHYFNQQWFDCTGLTEEQSKGWKWLQAVHPDDREDSHVQWARAVEEGSFMEVAQRLLCTTDKSYRWHLVRGAPLRDELGLIVQWVGTMTDIDDQRRETRLLERLVRERTADLERINCQLEEFAAVASHDLQEPLRKIQAFGDRLQTKCSPALGKQGREYLERILNSAARMRTLINDLLAFSRITTERHDFLLVDLAAVAFEVVSDLEELIQQTGGIVEISPLPKIRADPLQIRQLFQNLIGNGLKFHHPGTPPVVRLTARPVTELGGMTDTPRPAWHEIAIEDNGIGFEEIYLDRIFQVFQRLHGRSDYEGTGMGLAICRKIVERHMGRITARSTPGQGSTFLVILPADLHDWNLTKNDERLLTDHDPVSQWRRRESTDDRGIDG